jgi:hypothetical protein
MANQLSVQIDPISNGIQALRPFYPLLVALMADNVWPHAALQLEILGDHFPVNGPAAREIKSSLQRCASARLNQFALLSGWTRGDTAARMAESSGGQAIALLALCLSHLYSDSHPGEIIYRVSERLLSRENENIESAKQLCNASAEHLRDAVKVLANKTATMRYGLWLAAMVKKVADACEDVNGKWPKDISDVVTTDTTVELLIAVSESLLREDTFVRVTGTQGMGYIVAIVLFLFPEDTVFMVDGQVKGESIRRKIILDVRDTGVSLSTIELHRTMGNEAPFTLPIKVNRASRIGQDCGFPWDGWAKERLGLRYFAAGQKPKNFNILESCCGLLMAFGRSVENGYTSGTTLLASVSLDRMRQTCRRVFETDPPPLKDCRTAFEDLQQAFHSSHDLKCICTSGPSSIARGWLRSPADRPKSNCILHQLWDGVGQALNDGFACFFIDADENVTVVEGKKTFVTDCITDSLDGRDEGRKLSHSIIREMVFGLLGVAATDAVGLSNGACTLYPMVLQTLQVPSEWQVGFRLVDGRFVYGDQYFDKLVSCTGSRRPKMRSNVVSNLDDIFPCNNGPQYEVLPTIQRRMGFLELRMNVRVKYTEKGKSNPTEVETVLDMKECCAGFLELVRTGRCQHYPHTETMLDPQALPHTIPTRLDSPLAANSNNVEKIAIALTKGDPTAQLLFCHEKYRAILMQDSCLTCAFNQAREQKFDLIIVH